MGADTKRRTRADIRAEMGADTIGDDEDAVFAISVRALYPDRALGFEDAKVTPYGAIGAVDVLANAFLRCEREPTLPSESHDGPVYFFCNVQGIAPTEEPRPTFRTKVDIAPQYGPTESRSRYFSTGNANGMNRTKVLKKPLRYPPRRFRFLILRRSPHEVRYLVYGTRSTPNLCRDKPRARKRTETVA